MKKIISFSLWGNNPMYWAGALKNIELAQVFYPGWICRFYVDETADKTFVEKIVGDNVEVIIVTKEILINHGCNINNFIGPFWRFWPSVESDVEIFLSRDCDSRISEREVNAVNEWIESNKSFHIMRDHPNHTTPILAGMWGSKSGIMSQLELDKKISEWTNSPHFNCSYGCDQQFLASLVYPKIIGICLEHSEFGIRFGDEIKPFPTQRLNFEFVGDVFDKDNVRNPDYYKIIAKFMGSS